VIYTNVLGFVPMLLFANVGNEYGKLWDFWWAGSEQRLPPASVALLCIGAVVGTLIGYSGWWCRSVVSATSFTLIGVVNKCLTILLNVLIWDQHATPGGIFSLFVCISGGLIYQQSPMRGASGKTEETEGSGTASADVETVELMEKEQGQSSAQKRRG